MSLVNKGVVTIGEATQDGAQTVVVVVGTARGGTSLIAGVLSHLGVYMGDGASSPVFEDTKLSDHMDNGRLIEAKELYKQYCSQHLSWGWKRPLSINYLDTVSDVFGKPLYIFIYKDILSIAQRNAISMLDEVLVGMKRAQQEYKKTIEFLELHKGSALLVSYDKAISTPDFLVDSIIDYCKLNVTDEQRLSALGFISPNPEEYLDSSRITKSQGRLGGVDKRKVFGWVRYVHPSMKNPATVDIFLNGNHVGSTLANLYRADLKEKFGEDCYFEYVVPVEVELKHGDKITAKASNDVNELDNSPSIV